MGHCPSVAIVGPYVAMALHVLLERKDKMNIKRLGPGRYIVSNGDRTVTVIQNPQLRGAWKWIAYADWDRYMVTDPLPTKRDAVDQAKQMLAN